MSSSDFEERVVTIPLRQANKAPIQKKADKAMTLVREHLAKHFKVDESEVRLDPSLNETLWANGRQKPPRKLRVRAARFEDEGETVVEAEPAE